MSSGSTDQNFIQQNNCLQETSNNHCYMPRVEDVLFDPHNELIGQQDVHSDPFFFHSNEQYDSHADNSFWLVSMRSFTVFSYTHGLVTCQRRDTSETIPLHHIPMTNNKQKEPRRSRLVLTHSQLRVLEQSFKTCEYASRDEKEVLSIWLGITEKQVSNWFQNRRAKKRRLEKIEEARDRCLQEVETAEAETETRE